MKYEDMYGKMLSDPSYVSTITRADIQNTDATPEEMTKLYETFTRIRSYVTTYQGVTIAHPWWREGPAASQWSRTLLSQALRSLMAQTWAGYTDVPYGSLWEWNQTGPLLPHYQVWYKGEMIPQQWH